MIVPKHLRVTHLFKLSHPPVDLTCAVQRFEHCFAVLQWECDCRDFNVHLTLWKWKVRKKIASKAENYF